MLAGWGQVLDIDGVTGGFNFQVPIYLLLNGRMCQFIGCISFKHFQWKLPLLDWYILCVIMVLINNINKVVSKIRTKLLLTLLCISLHGGLSQDERILVYLSCQHVDFNKVILSRYEDFCMGYRPDWNKRRNLSSNTHTSPLSKRPWKPHCMNFSGWGGA